jgi:hypothetical protein
MIKTATLIALLILPFAAHAGCYCACVNGVNQPICQSTMDLPPLCGMQLCPIAPLSLPPILPLKLPPLGAQTCVPQQVWDRNLNRYVWKRICY